MKIAFREHRLARKFLGLIKIKIYTNVYPFSSNQLKRGLDPEHRIYKKVGFNVINMKLKYIFIPNVDLNLGPVDVVTPICM